MDPANLLAAAFAEHESDAPDVTQTRLGIEAELARRSHRRPMLATTAAVAAVAAVIAVAAISIVIRSGHDAASRPGTGVGQPPAAQSSTAHVAPTGRTPTPAQTFPFRPGWLPPGATFDSAEIAEDNSHLEQYSFGAVPQQVRGLTLWSDDEPLLTRLRDGGVLRSTTIAGRPARGGWSPSSHTYTLSVLRPGKGEMTVLAYGWDEATASRYATHTARDMRYGRFPEPTRTH